MGLTNYPACKSLILLVSGYNLKVRGSNPLPATNSLIINNIFSRFYFILYYLIFFCQIVIFFQSKIPPNLSLSCSSFRYNASVLSSSTMPVSTKPLNNGLRSLADRASPASNPLDSRWPFYDHDKPRLNTSYRRWYGSFLTGFKSEIID